jgi:hypothetical protein
LTLLGNPKSYKWFVVWCYIAQWNLYPSLYNIFLRVSYSFFCSLQITPINIYNYVRCDVLQVFIYCIIYSQFLVLTYSAPQVIIFKAI